jgi:hypothetical protein
MCGFRRLLTCSSKAKEEEEEKEEGEEEEREGGDEGRTNVPVPGQSGRWCTCCWF